MAESYKVTWNRTLTELTRLGYIYNPRLDTPSKYIARVLNARTSTSNYSANNMSYDKLTVALANNLSGSSLTVLNTKKSSLANTLLNAAKAA